MRALIASTLLLWGSMSLAPDAAAAQSADANPYADIRFGAVPDEHLAVSWGQATTVVNAPIDAVAAVVHDYDRYQELMPSFRASRVLSRRGDDALVYLEVGVARDTVTLWGQLRILSRVSEDHSRTVEATMMRGNVDAFRARWQLTPIDGGQRTRVEFRILVDPDMPLPASIFTEENVKVARRMLRAVRDRATL